MHPINDKYLAAGTIAGGTDIGHGHRKVSSIEKSLDFYCGIMGFELMAMYGDAAFISAGGYHANQNDDSRVTSHESRVTSHDS